MQIWEFFKKPDDRRVINESLEHKYMLYAITNKKSYAKRFMQDRDMDKFIIQKHKDVSKEEYAELANSERQSVLDVHEIMTVPKNKHTGSSIERREVLITYWEWQILEEPVLLFDDESFWQKMPFPLIFKDKYVENLKNFQYINFYKIFLGCCIPEHATQMFERYGIDDDYGYSIDIEYDQLSVLMDGIYDTLKY